MTRMAVGCGCDVRLCALAVACAVAVALAFDVAFLRSTDIEGEAKGAVMQLRL
jgi:hypothetical protein